MRAIYHCSKCGAVHEITSRTERPPVTAVKITCKCGNVLMIDDPIVRAIAADKEGKDK